MAIKRMSATLTPYHKKEGLSYLIKKLDRYARNFSGEAVAMGVETVARDIANDTYATYKSASYDGSINIRRYGQTSMHPFGNVSFDNNAVTVLLRPHAQPVGNNVIFYKVWAVEVVGQLGAFLEFGTGDKYNGSGYASRYAGTYMRHGQHFIGKNGLDTWVYKGEAGINPATPNNQVHKKNGEAREGYYYSQGNYPTRGLYNAVRKVRRSPRNVREAFRNAYYKWLRTNT